MYAFVPVVASALNMCDAVLPSNIRKKIDAALSSSCQLIAYAAMTDNAEIVGVAVALFEVELGHLDILHVEVHPEHRNQHIGRTLIARVQEEGERKGGKFFFFVYPQDTPETEIIERILMANNWKVRPFLIRCQFDPTTFNPPWLHTQYEYPPDYHEFLWSELRDEERLNLRHREAQSMYSYAVSPFRDEGSIEKLNSLGLRHQGRVVGWMITHRVDPDTISYSSLYIEPSLQFCGMGVKLLINSILLHIQTPTKYAVFDVPLLQTASSWTRFIKRRLIPYAIKITRFKQGWRTV